jgi:hypothetical protein
MSVFPPKADIVGRSGDVCFVPIADITLSVDDLVSTGD